MQKCISFRKIFSVLSAVVFLFLCNVVFANAASLSLSPSTGVYQIGGTFSVAVMVNTSGSAINAAEGTISFNTNELSVVSVNRGSSIFNLWVAEPTFSNSTGKVSFSGGLPSGYTGSAGNIMNITFRATGAGTSRVDFTDGSVLANDGRGTNVLTAMNGGRYTIQAQSTSPEPEVIEYVAPANTPAAPNISSQTHPDPAGWYKAKEAVLTWSVPADVVAVRTLLDSNPSTIPTKVYDTPIDDIVLSDLDEGVSYFHLQFRNADGWGRVAHYRLAVDTVKPEAIEIELAENTNPASPEQLLKIIVSDATSPISTYKVKVNNAEPFDYIDETGSSTILLPALEPGYHSVVVEAFDAAGNSIVGTFAFTIAAFDKPVFTEYPAQLSEQVIPVIKGLTRPNASVAIVLTRVGSEPTHYEVMSDGSGVFTFIPEGRFSTGVYELTAQATDEFGAQSEWADTIRIAVQQPGYIRIGSLLVSTLSVVIPLVLLLIALVGGVWYLLVRFRGFQRAVSVESREALDILRKEFTALHATVQEQVTLLQQSRKTKKLTKAESEMVEVFDRSLQEAQQRVEKEIEDVDTLTHKDS